MKRNMRTITRDDLEQLHTLAKEQDLVTARRARVLLMMKEDHDWRSICLAIGLSERTIRDIVRRFNEDGVAGLRRTRPPGRPPTMSQGQRKQLVEIIRRSPAEFGFDGSRYWSLASLAVAARREGALGDASPRALRSEIARIIHFFPELSERLSQAAPQRPGAPRGNANALRHGAYASGLSADERSLVTEIEGRLRHDFPRASEEGIHAAAAANVALQRALLHHNVEAAIRADRGLRQAIRALKSAGKNCRTGTEPTPAQWAAKLLRRHSKV